MNIAPQFWLVGVKWLKSLQSLTLWFYLCLPAKGFLCGTVLGLYNRESLRDPRLQKQQHPPSVLYYKCLETPRLSRAQNFAWGLCKGKRVFCPLMRNLCPHTKPTRVVSSGCALCSALVHPLSISHPSELVCRGSVSSLVEWQDLVS